MKTNTERDYRHRITRVIAAILADPAAPHTVDSLAAVAHFSPFHFHRIYRGIMGESIAQTVQRLRLAQAAHRLTIADEFVTAIALDVGYESSQAFARAFRGLTGVSPSGFQARQRFLAGPATPAMQEHVDIIELPAAAALCLRHDGPIATVGQTFRKLLRLQCSGGVSMLSPRIIGICAGDPEESGAFCYHAGLVPVAPLAPAAGVESLPVAGGLYARHRLIGPHELIAPTFRALFGGWLPRSGYEPDNRPALEFYNTSHTTAARKDYVTDLLIPICKV